MGLVKYNKRTLLSTLSSLPPLTKLEIFKEYQFRGSGVRGENANWRDQKRMKLLCRSKGTQLLRRENLRGRSWGYSQGVPQERVGWQQEREEL